MSVIYVTRTLQPDIPDEPKKEDKKDEEKVEPISEKIEIQQVEEDKEDIKNQIEEKPKQRSFGILQNNILRIKATHGAMEIILKKCQELGVQYEDDTFKHDASSLVHNAFEEEGHKILVDKNWTGIIWKKASEFYCFKNSSKKLEIFP